MNPNSQTVSRKDISPMNSNEISIFSFLNETNLTKEVFENNMKDLISLNPNDKEEMAKLLSIKNEIVLSMIDSAVKFNAGILFIKFIINLPNAKVNSKINDDINKINISEFILIYFKKLCLSIEANSSQKDLPLEKIINEYEEILIIVSDYFTKLLIQESDLSNFAKCIEKVAKEKINTLYIVFSIILYNLCKTSTNINIKEFIELLRINQLPITSSGINSGVHSNINSNVNSNRIKILNGVLE